MKRLHRLWRKVRHYISPKRLYRYGTMGLGAYDDRTPLEVLLDSIDNWFDNYNDADLKRRWKQGLWNSINWIDKLGNSREKIRASEKNGYAYMSQREWDQLADKSKKRIEDESHNKFKKRVSEAVREIKKGKKYNTPEQWARAEGRLKG